MSVATFRHDYHLKAAFLGLAYLDLVLTYIAVQSGYHEMNPLMMQLLANPMALVLVKGVAPFALAWLLPGRLLLPSTLFMFAVACWNLKEFAVGL